MTTASISLQDLRRRIYVTAKADKTKRFWGLSVHVTKLDAAGRVRPRKAQQRSTGH